jgi:hypothetical protein
LEVGEAAELQYNIGIMAQHSSIVDGQINKISCSQFHFYTLLELFCNFVPRVVMLFDFTWMLASKNFVCRDGDKPGTPDERCPTPCFLLAS